MRVLREAAGADGPGPGGLGALLDPAGAAP
ncbi:uncharacterized protein CLUP02_07284 [Colletotrichum lupini]|uniref:Uncharacterized protein n=1 Tax=Colletotrichum lupini TaxID=145971 RepID=A0A9Q8SRA3_9PEZI|nr:uncharacterized protein CLUP02_07284 [Colletotrichum lupini]UQC81798.1 hypothetical protein CLUP02_07284 [Colletotrichum lupini]